MRICNVTKRSQKTQPFLNHLSPFCSYFFTCKSNTAYTYYIYTPKKEHQ